MSKNPLIWGGMAVFVAISHKIALVINNWITSRAKILVFAPNLKISQFILIF